MKRSRRVALLVALLSVSALQARAQEVTPDTNVVTRAELQGLLDGMNEQMQALQADTDKLKKIKFSGYLQARTEFSEASNDSVGVNSAGAISTKNASRFYIRRGRLKLTYDSSPLSQAVIYLDGGQDRTVRLLEGYITLLDPWTPLHSHRLTVGQINVPFGWEIERSSSVRELPERSRAENVLFSGERDRGLKIDSHWTPMFRTTVAVLNGGGINSADFPATDPTRAKDWLVRGRLEQGTVDVGVSWYDGRHVTPLTGPDVVTDKTRFGADAEGYWTISSLGGGSIRGEMYAGHEVNADSVKKYVSTSGGGRVLAAGAQASHLATSMLGWYVMAVQNVGERLQAAARYDVYDPNTDVDHDQYARLSLGLNAFYDGFTRLSVSYDAITTDAPAAGGRFTDPHDNLWTIQLQHKF